MSNCPVLAGLTKDVAIAECIVSLIYRTVVDSQLVEQLVRSVGVVGGDTVLVLLVPKVLVSLDLVPETCVVLDPEVSSGLRPVLWAPSKSPFGLSSVEHGSCGNGRNDLHSCNLLVIKIERV